MKKIVFIASLAFVCFLTACGKKQHQDTAAADSATVQIPSTPYPRISAPTDIDMGVFDANHLQKTVVMKFNNIGTDTLYIQSVMPECDCTTLELSSDKVPPREDARVTVTLDLSEYVPGKITKQFSIISNSIDNRVLFVNLNAERK